jgi:chorismate-pyruvate lyase
MKIPAKVAGPELQTMLGLFPTAGDFTASQPVPPAELPEPYHELLVHEHHMTVTVEAHHGDKVDVVILNRRHAGGFYARRILLALKKSRRIVQYGLVRINFRYCSPQVRDAIVAGRTPLGRILINHNVLRRIEPTGFLRMVPGPELTRLFGLDRPAPTYGRLAYIHCNEQPAIELLEVVAPEEGGGHSLGRNGTAKP